MISFLLNLIYNQITEIIQNSVSHRPTNLLSNAALYLKNLTNKRLYFTCNLRSVATCGFFDFENDILSVSKELNGITSFIFGSFCYNKLGLFCKMPIDICIYYIHCMLSVGTEDKWNVLFITFRRMDYVLIVYCTHAQGIFI